MALTLTQWASQIAKAQPRSERIVYGPWQGSMRSRSGEQIPRGFLSCIVADTTNPSVITGASNYHYKPHQGWWGRRKGQTQKFDTFGAAVGMLPAKWGAKGRQMEEFKSDAILDGIPTVCTLATKETVASGLDDGRFSNFWLRDQVSDANYTVGSEFSSLVYPAPGSLQAYKVIPLWYDSGDGGISRGVTEFQRRLLFNGSRGFLDSGTQVYFPSLLGTPSRWDKHSASGSAQFSRPNGDGNGSWGQTNNGSQTKAQQIGEAVTDDGTLIQSGTGSDLDQILSLSEPIGVGTLSNSGWVLNVRVAKSTGSPGPPGYVNGVNVRLLTSSSDFSATITSNDILAASITTSPTTIQIALNTTQAAALQAQMVSGTAYIGFRAGAGNGGSAFYNVTQFWIDVPGSSSISGAPNANTDHLIPSGPIPPTHPGYITKGTEVVGSSVSSERPTLLSSGGGWTAFDGISAPDPNDLNEEGTTADPVRNNDGIRYYGSTSGSCLMKLSDFGFDPAADDTVKMRWKGMRTGGGAGFGGATIDVTVVLLKGITEIASSQQTLPALTVKTFEFTLSDAHKTAIGAGNWDDLYVRFDAGGGSSSDAAYITWFALEFTPIGSAEGGWHGFDRFPFALFYRFEDDSIFAFTTPRLPNSNLPDGLGIFTVDALNPDIGYDKITWHLPVPPAYVKKVGMLRGNKIDSRTDDNLSMNLHDLRLVAEVDAGVLTYDDYAADDDALYEDVDKLRIHEDHIMPPRARWIGAGDSRVCHAYGGLNPCAIECSPVGYVDDFDNNYADNVVGPFLNPSSYYRLTSTGLTLVRDSGSATSTRTFLWTDYATLQDLVDAINATSVTDTNWSDSTRATQWRAQILPGVNPQAATSSLCPTLRSITGMTISGTSLTKTAGGLSAVPVGAFVTSTGVDTNITDGTYVTAIVSDTQLTISQSGTSGSSKTLNFVANTGDSITGATHSTYEGYVRVIANSLPGFLFFTKTYLNQFPIEKSSVWMTSASPSSLKSAPNCFKGTLENKHMPPESSGNSMGVVGVDNGFVVPFSGKRAVIRNTRDSGTGYDRDYRLFVTNDASGACGPVVKGNRCAFVCAPEGWLGADLHNELPISGDIYQHPRSDAVTGVGDFSYEMPLCVAAAGADTDTAMMYARVMRNTLWVNYRTSASATHPNRRVCYDFSASKSAGLAGLVRDEPVLGDNGQIVIPAGSLYGWSLPLSSTTIAVGTSMTVMCEGRRSDGSHLYGWNQANGGSTGDGRIDEFETGDTDNGTAIAGSLTMPWESLGTSDNIAGQEIVFEHSSPTGATVAGSFTRSFTGDTYSCTPDVSSSLVVSSYRWVLSTAARVHSAACYLGWGQTAGGAGELRRVEFMAIRVKDMKPGTAG